MISIARIRVAVMLAAAATVSAATVAIWPQAPANAEATASAKALASTNAIAASSIRHDLIVLRGMRRADGPMSTADCQSQFQVSCYTPAQVQHAYHLNSMYARHITGRGQTIVVIDEFGSPTIRQDLNTFDQQAGLPGATLKVMQPVGSVPSFDPGDPAQVGWANETTLDVEWAHAIAPGARIVLLEVPDSTGLVAGLQYAIDGKVGDVISLSWGGPEQGGDSQALHDADGSMFQPAARKHITVIDATGDSGVAGQQADGTYFSYPVADWPATDPYVTAVGGSTLHLNDSGKRTAADSVWNDTYNTAANNLVNGNDGPNPLASGGGKSAIFGWPYYQRSVASFTHYRRGIPDISMSGACSGAVNVYTSIPGQPVGWTEVCGTSESAPIFAGVVALADQYAGHPLGFINPVLYQIAALHLPGITPITSGNNTVAFTNSDGSTQTINGYYARNGYSMAAGLGTIDARYLIPELVHPAKPPAHHKKPKPK